MSKKAEAFLADLEALCHRHGIQLATSGYDTLQIWDLDSGEPVIWGDVEDRTVPA